MVITPIRTVPPAPVFLPKHDNLDACGSTADIEANKLRDSKKMRKASLTVLL
jgi:hypothetical protein